MDNLSISIIIPVFNESAGIKSLMARLTAFKDKCEILFIDGGSNDKTADIISESFTVMVSPQKGRVAQMNYGAGLARGDVLFFLHADSLPPDNALTLIMEAVEAGYRAGCFRIGFDSKSPFMAICSFMSNTRVRLRNIAFGDQGIFIRKDYFERLGSFQQIPLMEDYRLSMDIKKDGEKIFLARGKIITSERRFIKRGRLRTMYMMQKLQYMYRRGVDIEKIAEIYNR